MHYNFKNNLDNLSRIWQQTYLDSGRTFNICHHDRKYKKKIRFYETLLYLLNKSYININNASFVFNEEEKDSQKSYYGLIINVTFLKSPQEIYNILDWVTYVELNVNQEFMNHFSAAKCIPHTDRSLFPSVKEWNSS